MDQFSDGTLLQKLLYGRENLGIAQNMRHSYHAPAAVRGVAQGDTFLHIGGNGLFQQQVVALFQRGHGVCDVLAVLRGDDGHVRQTRLLQQRFHIGVTGAVRQVEPRLGGGALFGVGVGHGDHRHILRVAVSVGRVHLIPAHTQTADDHRNRLFHGKYPPYTLQAETQSLHAPIP